MLLMFGLQLLVGRLRLGGFDKRGLRFVSADGLSGRLVPILQTLRSTGYDEMSSLADFANLT